MGLERFIARPGGHPLHARLSRTGSYLNSGHYPPHQFNYLHRSQFWFRDGRCEITVTEMPQAECVRAGFAMKREGGYAAPVACGRLPGARPEVQPGDDRRCRGSEGRALGLPEDIEALSRTGFPPHLCHALGRPLTMFPRSRPAGVALPQRAPPGRAEQHLPPNPQAAVRMLIAQAAQSSTTHLGHNAPGEPAEPAPTKNRVLCPACEREYGYPQCGTCRWNFS
jgi:hypothetical protein